MYCIPTNEDRQDPVVKEWDKLQDKNEGEKWKQFSVKIKKTPVHKTFDYISYVTCGVALLMIVAQLIGVYFFFVRPNSLLQSFQD